MVCGNYFVWYVVTVYVHAKNVKAIQFTCQWEIWQFYVHVPLSQSRQFLNLASPKLIIMSTGYVLWVCNKCTCTCIFASLAVYFHGCLITDTFNPRIHYTSTSTMKVLCVERQINM